MLPEVRWEQAFHLRELAGRGALLDAIDAALRGPGDGPVVLFGGPGSGKSALAAEIARRHGAPLFMTKSRRDAAIMLRSLIEQVAGAPEPRPISGDLEALRGALVEAVEASPARADGLVLVIDGLDELAGDRAIDALPAHLPPRARLLLTSRPARRVLGQLRARFADVHEIAVPPLDEADVRALWRARTGRDPAPARLAAVLERTGGLPLLVRRAVPRDADASEPDVETLPASPDDLFGEVVRAAKAGGPARLSALSFFCVAREPLDATALGALAGLSLADAHAQIEALSPYLVELAPGAFAPWHRGLAEHVEATLLGPDGVRAREAAFAAFCAERPASALRFRVAHLVAAGRAAEARAIVDDPSYRRAKLEAGLGLDLHGELDELGSPLAAAHRRHAAFLARHPAALRTIERVGEGPWLSRVGAPTAGGAGIEVVYELSGHSDEVFSLAISPSGDRVATASADGTLRLWDARHAGELWRRRVSARRALTAAFSPDAKVIWVGTDGEGVIAFDREGAELARRDEGATIWSIAVAPWGWVASGSRAGEVAVWDEAGRARASLTPGGVITGLSFAGGPDTRELAVVTSWGRLAVYALETSSGDEAPRSRVQIDDLPAPWAVAPSPGAPGWIVACADGALRRFDRAGALGAERALPDERLYALAVDAPRGLVACGGARGRVYLLGSDLEGPARSARLFDGPVDALAFAPDARGPLLVGASADHSARALRLADAGAAPAPERAPVSAACFSPDGATLAVGARDGELRLIATEAATPLGARALHASRITRVTFSADGALLATASQDGTATVHRSARALSGAPLARLVGHAAAVNGVAFVPPAGRIATASSDHTVRLWSIFGGRELCAFPLDDSVVAVCADPDGSRLAAVTRGARLFVLPLTDVTAPPTALPVAPLPEGLARDITWLSSGALAVELSGGELRAFQPGPSPRALDPEELAPQLPTLRAFADPLARETRVEDRGDSGSSPRIRAWPYALAQPVVSVAARLVAGWVDDELFLLRVSD